jgi:outer membrane lipoprotein SlyB
MIVADTIYNDVELCPDFKRRLAELRGRDYKQELFMIKRILIVALMGSTLAGCVSDSLSGNVYSSSQAKQVQNISYGTLVSVRPVQIQGDDQNNVIGAIGGAVLGGFLGNTIGRGAGRSLATAGGAVAGAVAGNAVTNGLNRANGVELQIRKDDGNTIQVVQKVDSSTKYYVGQRVSMATSGSTITVSPGV